MKFSSAFFALMVAFVGATSATDSVATTGDHAMQRLLKTVEEFNARGGTKMTVKNVRDADKLNRFLLSGQIIEYTNRFLFLADVTTDWLVDFSTQEGLNFKSSPQDIADTTGGFPFTMKGSADMSFSAGGATFTAGTVMGPVSGFDFGDGQFAFTSTGTSADVALEFKFSAKINAFGADLGGYNANLGTRFELDVMCPGGDYVLEPTISDNLNQFYGFLLDGDAAYQVNIRSATDGPAPDGIFWDNIVGRNMVQECIGCGDPHFLTWGNQWFDFHGICDLVFLSAPGFSEGLGLDIHVRTKERYEYSYIEATSIKIGEDILEVGSWGDYVINGVNGAKTPFTMGGKYSVTHEIDSQKKHTFKIQTGPKEAIIVSTHKDMVNIKIANATHANFATSTGLMGSFEDGLLLARDGVTVMDNHDIFGQEWQVTEADVQLFQTASPYKVCVPPHSIEQGRRLEENTISEEAASKACAHLEDEIIRDMCVFDIIAMNDMEAGDIHGAF